jgi:chemotaxis protein CheD
LDYLLKLGYSYLSDKPTVISTVLGSSVSISLYDKSLKKGGMNYSLFPLVEKQEKTTACYGNVACRALVRMMIDSGSAVKDLEAQVFGAYSTQNIHPGILARRIIKRQKKFLSKKESELYPRMSVVNLAEK